MSRGLGERIERRGLDHAIRFTGYVPFEDLPALYSLAEMFVFPSMHEGFGLPVVEAMACGVPVITGTAVGADRKWAATPSHHVDRLDADRAGRGADRSGARTRAGARGCRRRGRRARADVLVGSGGAGKPCEIYRQRCERRTRAVPPS